MLPTCAVSCTVHDQAGRPEVGATVTARLSSYEVYQGYVVPEVVTATTDAYGVCVLNLWPNQLGAVESLYNITITPTAGRALRTTATVPNQSSAQLHLIAELPPYDGKTDGQLILDDAVAAGAVAVAKAAEAGASATAAAGSASSAEADAAAAELSKTASALSATQAGQSAAQAAEAKLAAEDAESNASTYSALTSAKADEAAASALASAGSKTDAEAAAAIATAKATEADASADAAAASAIESGNSATSSGQSKVAAESAADQAAIYEAQAKSHATTAGAKAGESTASATSAAASAAAAADSEETVALSAAAAAASKTAAETAAASAEADRIQTGLDAEATAADRVQTGLDRTEAAASETAAEAAAETATTKAAEADASADAALAKSIIATDAANNASAAVQSQLQAIKSQTETARDQALAGLGAADNSQVLSELLGTITYALDLAGQAAKEMPSLAALFPAIDSIGTHIVAMMDLLGVTARTVAGGDVLLGPGLVGAPSLAAFSDRNTGIYFPTADQLAIVTGGIQRLLVDASGNHATGTDNAQSLGTASKRWSTVYAGTGTINTSDAREKTTITPLSAAELAAASAMAKEIGSYQFLASIADKGDAARHHIGLTVQRAIEIMEANGLNPFKYGFICHDTWPEFVIEHPATEAVEDELDEEGNVIRPGTPAKDATTEIVQAAGDRYAFRYDQLALFIAAGFEARLSALETA